MTQNLLFFFSLVKVHTFPLQHYIRGYSSSLPTLPEALAFCVFLSKFHQLVVSLDLWGPIDKGK